MRERGFQMAEREYETGYGTEIAAFALGFLPLLVSMLEVSGSSAVTQTHANRMNHKP
jgi:hypothetical protein